MHGYTPAQNAAIERVRREVAAPLTTYEVSLIAQFVACDVEQRMKCLNDLAPRNLRIYPHLQTLTASDSFEALVMHMTACGWVEKDGVVTHPLGMAFGDWMQAIRACIEVASEA